MCSLDVRPHRPILFVLAILVLAFAVSMPASAATIEKDFPFELDTWYDLDFEDGSLTVQRVRVAHLKSNLKSRLFRGSDTEFVETVQVQVEYVNNTGRDYEAALDIVWVDAKGREIDGYRGKEEMDEGEHDEMTAALSTSKYGLERAKTLKVKIVF
ncbi:MAG: hypothetical protein AAGC60_00875 [Acidobacteriota bacterium]